MCDTASQPASNLIAEARGVLNRNHGRWPEADWQTLDRFVRVAVELINYADMLIMEDEHVDHVHVAMPNAGEN